MTANVQPIFPLTPNIGTAQVSVANSNRDGATGNYATVFTPGALGSVIQKAYVKAIATTTAGMVRIFQGDGANWRLLLEIPVTAVTPSGIVQTFEAELYRLEGLVLKTGYTLKASTENTETFNVLIFGGDY
jgi:hypothetical protein